MPVINGTSLEVQNRVIQADGLMVQMQEHFDPFILNWQLKHPSMFRDRIPMAKYPAFSGVSQESYIFRGSNSADQAGLADWRDVTPSSKASGANPANDRCSYDPKTFDWAWDKIGYSGKRREWKSPVFCVMDLYTQDQAREQLSMIITAGAEVTDQTREVYNREMYMKLAVNANKFVVLAEGMGLSYIDNPLARVSYDPAAVDTDGDTYIEFDKSLFGRISTLNWSPFNLIRAYMADAAPDAAQGMDSGMPIFTLLIDLLDFEEMIFNDSKVREDMRYTKEAQQLISGYNMGFKIYRGMGIVHDVRQARYDGGQIGVGLNAGTLFGQPVVRCKRIKPRRATRPGVVGMIPETNPDYITAPYGTAVLFLNNVAQVLVPDPISNLGSGLTFGPAPGFNGQWQWINHKNNTDNPLGEVGYFFSRFEYHLRAMRYAEHAMVVLYKRCQQVIATNCAIDSAASAKNTSMLEDAPVAADFDGTALTVELSLANKLTAGVGKKVTIKKDDDTNEFEAFIMDAQNAPVYKFGWITGGANVPAAVGEINDITVVTVTVA